MIKKIISSVALGSLIPVMVLAQDQLNSVTNADTLITKIDDLVNSAVWLFISLAVLFIIWNAVMFIIKAGTDDRKKYQSAVLWGIVGLFVILSIWGLVYILSNTLSVDNGSGQTNAQDSVNSLILKKPSTTGTP